MEPTNDLEMLNKLIIEVGREVADLRSQAHKKDLPEHVRRNIPHRKWMAENQLTDLMRQRDRVQGRQEDN